MDEIIIRNATLQDIEFLVDTIIEAEKSGTSILTYTTIFGLTEKEARYYVAKMLEEEIDGCELSVSGFLLAKKESKILGAIGAWIEGSEGISSTILKGNLLKYTLPPDCLQRANSLNNVVRDLHIEYIPNTIQIGLVYVHPEARGKGLVSVLLKQRIDTLMEGFPDIKEVYIQVFGNNLPAIKAYERAGFREFYTKNATLSETSNYMPGTKKVLMRKII